jgi:hypothetical protein
MEYFEGIDTQRSFPTIFRQLSDNFPTIFRQLSDNFPTNESKSKRATPGPDPSGLHSSTLPLRHTNFLEKTYV